MGVKVPSVTYLLPFPQMQSPGMSPESRAALLSTYPAVSSELFSCALTRAPPCTPGCVGYFSDLGRGTMLMVSLWVNFGQYMTWQEVTG